MTEARRALLAMDDATLEGALRDLAAAIAYPAPAAGPDIASRVRQRIEAAPPAPARRGPLAWLRDRPVRRSLLVAVAALLILAAVAGAVGLGVPGIRIFFGGATPTLSPTASPAAPSATPGRSNPVGLTMGLGTAVSLDDAERLAGIDLVLPPDPDIGPPDAAYLFQGRVALVWSERPGLPPDPSTGAGLLLSQFRGLVDEGYYRKQVVSNGVVTPVTVNSGQGFWISGPPHFFVYVDENGRAVEDSHRMVGDTLVWSVGDMTYRLESQLGMEEAIRLAESLE